jgi:hypothetical protein
MYGLKKAGKEDLLPAKPPWVPGKFGSEFTGNLS